MPETKLQNCLLFLEKHVTRRNWSTQNFFEEGQIFQKGNVFSKPI